MRVVPLDEAAIGLRLGRSVTDYRGNVLLQAGVDLTPGYIDALRARGLRSVPVWDPLAPDAVPSDGIRDETRRVAVAALEQVAERARSGGVVPVPAVRRAVEAILADIGANPNLAFNLASLRSVEDVLFTHSMHVGVYALVLGHSLALEPYDLHGLGVGAMLHDVGKVFFLDLVGKPGALTPDERQTMQQHTMEGFRLLRDEPRIDLRAAQIALQHHERLDGSGYPRGLRGDAIHPWAQLTAVVDLFDTITADVPYGSALPPHQAMAKLESMAQDGKLNTRLVRHLMWRLAAYPEGTILMVESGEVAVVVGQTPLGGQCPRVRVLCDEHLQLVPASERVLEGRAPGDTVRTVLADYPPALYQQIQRAARSQ